MTHPRPIVARLFAACSLLLVGGTSFWLMPRGLAQAAGPSGAASGAGAAGGDAAGNASMPSGAAGNRNAQTGDDSSANSDAAGDSAVGPDGQAAANPPVGVDTVGRGDATATRNGRTTRRRLPAPQNPIVITDSMRGSGSTSLGTEDQNRRLPAPTAPQAPGDYTVPADPAFSGLRGFSRPLPLFGYDFFQPARQIITARRHALLPAPAPRRTPARTNGGNGTRLNPAGSGTGNAGAAYTSGGNGDNGSAGSDQSGADASGTGSNGTNANGTDLNGAGLGAAAALAVGQGRGAGISGAAGGNTPDAGGSSDTANADGSSDTTDASPDTARNASRRRAASNTDSNTGFNADAAQDGATSGGSFPGDTATPGGDLQFPGDDALVQNGAANAVAGQIADPLSTLTQGVLASLPTGYQLQPGDRLVVRYSALTIAPREVTETVDSQGGISLAEAGRVSVVGRTSAQAEDALRQRLSRLYRDVDVSISLSQLRTIQVTVSGAAFDPGTYTVPATATAFNLLSATGGPTAEGTLRDIRVLRSGRRVGTLDIYPLLGASSGSPSSRSGDVNLQSGDTIYIPNRLSRIAIRGEVRQEAIYELTPTETLRDALRYAGGVKPSGVGQTIHIDTTDPGRGRVIRDVAVTSRATVAGIPLFDGDTVEVASVRAILTNRVTIEGAVNEPGDYALYAGMHVLDLIQLARGIQFNTYQGRADLVRTKPDFSTTLIPLDLAGILGGGDAQNVALERFDRVRLYTRQEVAYLGRRVVTVRGAVQRPGLYTQMDNMRVSDLVLQTGGPLPEAYLSRAVLLHQRGDGTFSYDYVNLRGALAGDSEEDLPIQDNDILAVYNIGEAHFTPDHTVKVLGNVVAPGLYARGEGMKLSDLLKLAGAFKPGGGTRVTVAHARRPVTDPATQIAPVAIVYNSQGASSLGTDLTLQDGDVVAVQGDGSIKDHPAVVTVTGSVNRPGPIIVTRGMRLSDAVREAGGLRPEAFPQGSEFTRSPDTLITTGQMGLAQIISGMSDMLNLSQYQRERAKSNLELITAAGSAASGAAGGGIAIPGITPGAGGTGGANPNTAGLFQNLAQNNLVSQGRILTPSQLQPNGTVAVRLADALRRPGGMDDFLLKDGDTLVVPETPTTVQVIGAVFSPSGVVFKPGQPVDYYIKYAGGFTPDSAGDRIEVIHAGGGLIPAAKAGAIQPGDLILVPTRVLAEKVSRSGGGFNSLFQGLVGSAITLKVLSSVFGL